MSVYEARTTSRPQTRDEDLEPGSTTRVSREPTGPVPGRFAGALADLALAVRATGLEAQNHLQVIADTVVELVPAVSAAAVVVPAGPHELAPAAVHGDLPARIMGLQNELGEGPCLQAVAVGEVVRVRDLLTDERWPVFRAAAESAGLPVRSMICTPLVSGAPESDTVHVQGALCVASPSADGFDAESADLIAVFAAHAGVALGAVADRQNLRVALATRDVIGQAKGILMERLRITEATAFQVLVKASQKSNQKLRQVCVELCDTGALPD